MQEAEIEELLNDSEGTALDFKRDQYPFTDDTEKGEFIKDVLAFTNSWRRTDAFILIGVEELKGGGRSNPVGITKHLKDSDLQQLVNSKIDGAQRTASSKNEVFVAGSTRDVWCGRTGKLYFFKLSSAIALLSTQGPLVSAALMAMPIRDSITWALLQCLQLGNFGRQTFTLRYVYRANEVGCISPLTRVSKGYRLRAF